ncbi:YHS domain-containing protein [Polaribacter vadi]|uniref:YHS domain-containing (seleno)protein n=1 Tax=Polaribacter TaxID=52959 RepID=UPI001C087EFF|nr:MULTISPECIES: YHS domain-containing (seleno)protein [Polaribacter]MBU3012350.1 YHS domain-containing protein [Polaribacter vadi]MDO6742167.1 YHS domain-containing (seleno)protein [Polaribacter sp. 1_MG-2023]
MKHNLKEGIAAQEYDVVSFFDGKPQKGNASITASFENGTFYFASEANKSKFEKSPEKFAPQYGGYCAIAMSEGAEANPNPKSWEVRDGKLYFFTRMFFGIIDAKRQWVKKPEELRDLADYSWAKMNA